MNYPFANPYQSPWWWARYIPVALLLLAVIVLLLLVGGPVLVPLILSFALAFMLEPLVNWFQRRFRSTRNAAVLFALAVATFGTLLVVILLLPSIYSQFVESYQKLPQVIATGKGWLQKLLEYSQKNLSPDLYNRLQENLAELQKNPPITGDTIYQYLTQGVFGLVNLSSAAIGLLIVPFFVYYLLLDMHNIRLFIEKRIPERHRGVGLRLFNEMGEVVRGYVRGRFLIALILSAFYAAGLWLLGVPLWAAIGLIAGLVGIIPYVGIIAGIVLALGFAAIDGGDLWTIVGVIAVFTLAQPLEDYVLTPRIIGESLDLHPMLILIALLIAGSLFGVLGLVLAIPVVGVAKVMLKFFDELYLHSDFYTAPALAAGESNGTTVLQQATAAATSDAKQEADTDKFEAAREVKHSEKP
jgi:predicted PurR-regulated permease PerM